MKTKDEIKHEIYDLAQKVSRASSEKFLLETAREIYELAALLKHAPKDEAPAVAKQEEKPALVSDDSTKPEAQPAKQATIDLFSAEVPETTQAEAPSAPTQPEPQPQPQPIQVAPEKIVSKEKKEPKKKNAESVAEKLQHNKISDLKSAIGINEKFQFINELFEGNMKEYTVAVDQVNSFSTHAEAESYLANLQDIYKWEDENSIVGNFKELVQRRFI